MKEVISYMTECMKKIDYTVRSSGSFEMVLECPQVPWHGHVM